MQERFPLQTDDDLSAFLKVILEARMIYAQAVVSAAMQQLTHEWDESMRDGTVAHEGRVDTDEAAEEACKRLSEAAVMLTILTRSLERSEFVRQHQLSDDLRNLLPEARVTLSDLEDGLKNVRSMLDISRGKAGLQESRKSIRMAELSIAESKRVKLLTVLAFIFVPLSLTTSIFGMNIEQINQSGPSWWVVIATAGAMVFVAFLGWGFANRATRMYDNRLEDFSFKSNDDTKNWRKWRYYHRAQNLPTRTTARRLFNFYYAMLSLFCAIVFRQVRAVGIYLRMLVCGQTKQS